MKTQKEKELLETLRKWEDLCHEAIADAAYWKAQAKESLAALKELCADKYLADPINADRMKNARAAISKAEGRA